MPSFIVRRLLQGAVVIFGVTTVVFFVTRVAGDPVRVMAPLDATPAELDALRAQLGFDRPMITQYLDFLGGGLRLDFGESLRESRPALDVVLDALPRTLVLVVIGLVLAIVVSLPLGALAALRPDSVLDRVLTVIGLVGLSAPQFWMGLMLIIVFGVGLGWFPTSGIGGVSHVVLPAVTLAMPAAGRLTMLVRSSMLEQLNSQYVKALRTNGADEWRVVAVHAGRNAALPVVTLAGWELILAISGATVLLESVFAWPGIGFTLLRGIERQDLFVVQAAVLVIATLVVVVNTAIDIGYSWLDPRVKVS